MNSRKSIAGLVSLTAIVGLAGCGSSSDVSQNLLDDITVPNTYAFESGFDAGDSSVSYSGQTARQVLIEGLNAEIATGLQAKMDDNTWDAATPKADIEAVMEDFYDGGTDTLSGNAIEFPALPGNSLQQTYSDLSGGKNLVDKTAGNDDVTDHRDWDNGGFVGWSTAGSPELLVRDWFSMIADNVMEELDGTNRQVDFSASNSEVHTLEVYHTDDGLDLKQLVQKFLLGAVTLSQGMDDYLDDDEDGKGLLSDNINRADGTEAFTELEHQWDEGFGYFGAARDYLDYTDDEIAGKGGRAEYANGYHDTNTDGSIDLEAEFNFGNSTNAAKRDRGSTTGTDFTTGAFEGFAAGRAIINQAVGRDLNGDEMLLLMEQRDKAIENWEKAIAATVVHYINDTLGDMNNFGTGNYSYADHTKHWGELKGFALGLQFNPRSPLLDDNDSDGTEDFEQFHSLVGERPVLPDAPAQDIADYEQALLDARDLMQTAYGFAAQDVQNW